MLMLQGVLIVGERGTGKTSLALAIAAEAKVPVVNVEAQELEAGLWVGQSASNVRELFQTARDLVVFLKPFSLFFGFSFPGPFFTLVVNAGVSIYRLYI